MRLTSRAAPRTIKYERNQDTRENETHAPKKTHFPFSPLFYLLVLRAAVVDFTGGRLQILKFMPARPLQGIIA
jgi:hypothetical protein